MVWVVDLKPDRESKSVVRQLCSAGFSISSESSDSKSHIGVIVCSSGCETDEICTRLRDLSRGNPQVVVLHLTRCRHPWEELAAGAADVVQWDGRTDPVCAKLDRIAEVEDFIESPDIRNSLVGSSASLRHALRELVTAARFGTGPILILGESGTGKELAARIAHRADSGCCNGPLVVVDCTTIVSGLSGSELFGHERGAFTGAVSARSGACSAANRGCLFLDEIGELPLDLQPELLRVVQEGTYKHVGGDRWQHSSFRLICATNRDLLRDVTEGRFRNDLYYRIAASTIELPPLRERGEDILTLFAHFYQLARGIEQSVSLDPTVEAALCGRAYPGNLRDLRQLAVRVAARHVGDGPVSPGDMPVADRPTQSASVPPDGAAPATLAEGVRRAVAAGTTLRGLRDEVTNLAIDAAIAATGGSIKAAAKRLGVTDRALHLRRSRSKTGPASS